MLDWGAKFETGLPYAEFLTRYGSPEHQRRWAAQLEAIRLTPAQTELLGRFKRQMKVLVMAGAWCGDCVQQCPILERFVQACPVLTVRYVDRDADPAVAQELALCGAARVPQVVFLSEDNHYCGRYGDRTLARYRDLVSTLDGASCPSGLVGLDQSLQAQVTQCWLDEFERIQWMLRTSGRLRQLHGD